MNFKKNILIILAHPDINKSIGNKFITNRLNEMDNVEVRNLNLLYPDHLINVEQEQDAMKKADIIVFQYPLFWYNVPSIMKEWIDRVFTFGFAFGKGTYELEGKKVIASFTTGTSVKDYPEDVIEKIAFPIKGLADYCKMDYITQVISHEINGYSEEAKKKSEYNAELHAQQIIDLVNTH